MLTTRAGRAAVLLSVLAFASAAVAQAPPPDYADDTRAPAGRRGERIRQLIDVVNSGDLARVDALVADAFGGPFRDLPKDAHRDALLSLHDGSRRIELYSTRRYTPPRPDANVVAIARNELTGGWIGLSLTFDGTPEERISWPSPRPCARDGS